MGTEKIGTASSLGEQETVIQLDNRALDSKEKAATCKGSSRRGVREPGSTTWWPGRRRGGWWAEGAGCTRRPLNPSADLGDSVTRTDAHHTATSSPAHPRQWQPPFLMHSARCPSSVWGTRHRRRRVLGKLQALSTWPVNLSSRNHRHSESLGNVTSGALILPVKVAD